MIPFFAGMNPMLQQLQLPTSRAIVFGGGWVGMGQKSGRCGPTGRGRCELADRTDVVVGLHPDLWVIVMRGRRPTPTILKRLHGVGHRSATPEATWLYRSTR